MQEEMEIARTVARRLYIRIKGNVEFEELYSEALLGLVIVLPKYNPDRSSLKTFLYRSLSFYLIDYLRKTSFHSRLACQKIKSGEIEPTKFFSLDLKLSRRTTQEHDDLEDRDYVESLMRKCCKRDRHILQLHYLEGFTMHEVGILTGYSESRISQCIQEIKKRLLGDTHANMANK